MDQALSPLGAFACLVLGVVCQALLQRFVYPLLSRAHEGAKVTGRQTVDPSRFMLMMRIINFLVLPVVGFFFGAAFLGR